MTTTRITTNCPSCAESGERGSCARFRCYCGHPGCWAYDSYHHIGAGS